jgi:GTP:adenosylcobinamide-phosphate guanylyltransferase
MSIGATAILLAGSRPGGDPFAEQFGTSLKALIPVLGEPMVRRPAAALLASEEVARVRVLTQDPERIAEVLPKDARLTVEHSQGTIAETLIQLCKDPATEWPLLITTADHALLTPEIIHDFCWRLGQADLAIGVVSRRRFEGEVTQSRRTWIPFKGGAYTGANLFMLRSDKVIPAIEMWRSVEQDRKRAWKLLSSMGPLLFLKILLRQLSLDDALHSISTRLGIIIRAIHLSDPTAAVDVDKMSDHQLAEKLLSQRA